MSVPARRIDHLVLAVADLDAAAQVYQKLGFQVGARNRHPWGTENRLVQFQSSFLELITVGDDPSLIQPHGPRHFSFGAYVRDSLANGEGLAMVVLDSGDAQADATAFANAGIGDFEPFFFERKGRRPDGSEIHVAFTLAFAMDPALPDTSFFVCQQHYPEAFWNPLFQNHLNGAENIEQVILSVENAAEHTGFFATFTGSRPDADGETYRLSHGGSLLLAPSGSFAGEKGFCVRIADLSAVSDHLEAEEIPFTRRGDRIQVPASACFGVTVEFAAA